MKHQDQRADVIIVGGGPVGLALAAELGWRGNSVILLEQSDGIVHHPKMDGIDLRVMEFCRRWGLVERMKQFPFPKNYPNDMVYVTSLSGFELGRESFATPSGGTETSLRTRSPEVRIRCPQTFFDPILRDFAASFASTELRFECRYTQFEDDGAGVTVHYEHVPTGKSETVRSRFLVACDGANSAVREQLGIGFEGPGIFNYTTNVLFRSADLFAYHDKRPAYRWLFVGPEGAYATMSAINGRDEWRVQLFSNERRALTDEEIGARLKQIVGRPFEHAIITSLRWTRRELVADRYRKGNVFMAGDACHATSPTGGFGMNTGIKDAVDLAWKLDAVLKGWAGPKLLDAYEAERRPSGARAVREASGNWARMMSAGSNPQLLDPTYDGALHRYDVGRRFSATMLREWYKLGIDLGYVYDGSPICWQDHAPSAGTAGLPEPAPMASAEDDPAILREMQRLQVHLSEGTKVDVAWRELDAAEVMVYRQSSRPGARAPHVWLADGRSTLDLFGRGFVLLRLGSAPPSGSELEASAKRSAVPLEVVACDQPDVLAAYEHPLVLVRPDGHVAWRGARWPAEGTDALIDRVRGA